MVKKVCGAIYAHESNIDELMEYVPSDLVNELNNLLENTDFEYTVVKYDNDNVTLIYSPDWDTANEPIVGKLYRYKAGEWDKEPKVMENWKQIYHNKWQFVADDYMGFDIDEAKERTALWNSIPGINDLKSKIGYKNFWIELLDKNNIQL